MPEKVLFSRIEMTETEYQRNLQLIEGQVDRAIESFYTEREINQIASERPAVLFKLNRDAAFWNLVTHSLQSTFFMTLGRVFDTSDDTHSIHRLLSVTVAHPEFFSKAALMKRKIALEHGIPYWLDSYMETTWEPNISDLRALKKTTAPFSKKYRTVYLPIRNDVFGHNIVVDDGKVYELFEKTAIKEIDEILFFLHDLIKTLSNLFLNGKKPDLGKESYGYRQEIRDRVQSVLFDLARITPEPDRSPEANA